MHTFLDGPAAGEDLPLTRTPLYLRVTQNGPCFRTLEDFTAEPDYTELIYVYLRVSRNPATYQLLDPQPKENRINQTHAWRGWTQSQINKP